MANYCYYQEQRMLPAASTLFNKYFNEVVQLSNDDKGKVVKFVQDMIHAILVNCNQLDRRISIEPVKVGGYWSHLKVKRPDEFDLNVIFAVVENLRWGGTAPTCTFRLKNAEKGNIVMEDTKQLPDGLETYELCNTNSPLPPKRPGYVSIVADVPQFSYQGVVVPFLVKRFFRSKLRQAVEAFNNNDRIKGKM